VAAVITTHEQPLHVLITVESVNSKV